MTQALTISQQLAARAQRQQQLLAQTERARDSYSVSLKGGMFRVNDEELPGNRLIAVVASWGFARTYYEGAFDPTKEGVLPTCFANYTDKATAAPNMPEHAAFVAQSTKCGLCKWAAFGTALQGKGPKCKERVRLALISAGSLVKQGRNFDLALQTDPQHFADAPILTMSCTPTAAKAWETCLKGILAQSPYLEAAVVEFGLAPSKTHTAYDMSFEHVGWLGQACFEAVLGRVEKADLEVLRGYQPPRED